MYKWLTLMTAAFVLALAPLAQADIENFDLDGELTVVFFYSENTYDFDDDGPDTGWIYELGRDDEIDFIRVEAILTFSADLADNVMVLISLEADRELSEDDSAFSDTASTGLYRGDPLGTDDLEIFIQEAWVDIKEIWGTCISVKLGRQFIEFGDGFVYGDAHPGVPFDISDIGEWEQEPFDAVRLTADLSDYNFVIDFVYSKEAETHNIHEDFTSAALNASFIGLEDHVIEGYVIYSDVDGDGIARTADLTEELVLVGLRAAGDIMDTLAYKAEVAFEWGDIELPMGGSDIDVDGAWALELGVEWSPEADRNPYLGFTYTFFSGNDGDEFFDDDAGAFIAPFENKTYGEIADGLIQNNRQYGFGTGGGALVEPQVGHPWAPGAHIFNLNGGFDLNDKTQLSASYYYIMLDEDDAFNFLRAPVGLIDDDDLGHELDGYLDYQFNDEVTMSLAGGIFFPGDAVEDSRAFYDLIDEEPVGPDYDSDDEAFFLRAMVNVKF